MPFRILDIPPQGACVVDDAPGTVGRPPAGTLRWVDLQHQDDATLALLRERFELHPLAIEDCSHFDQRPKLEEYDGHLFIVIHGLKPTAEDASVVEPLEVHAFVGKDFLVTVHDEPVPEIETIWKRMAADAAIARRGVDFIYYALADAIVDSNFVILDRLNDTLDEIEDEVLHRTETAQLSRIFVLKKTLVSIRRVLSPQRDVFGLLSKRGHPCISDRAALYFRDVYDHLVRIHESIDSARDLLGNALDAYLSMVAQRTNEVMKRLTLLSAVFLPLTFLTGFFGQNFTALPFDNKTVMWIGIGLCGAIPIAMVLWFYRSRWLD